MSADIPLITLESSPREFLAAASSTGFLHLSLDGSPMSPDLVRTAFSISPKRLEERRTEMAEFFDACYELELLVLDKLSAAFDVRNPWHP